ncbi:MAG: acyl carrier protein [Desulfovibrio sp.]|nr:acyl carrier protein [Desulfovibrio sp.]
MMTNDEKYLQAFMQAFEVDADTAKNLKYQAIPAWDSVGHMGLVAALEEAFDIMLEPDDIVDMSSFAKGKELLAKYDISF